MTARKMAGDKPKDVTDVDRHIAARVRTRRVALGIIQGDLAKTIGVSKRQQLQKYEAGENRISAPLLFEIARVLNVPIDYFFEGLDLTETRPVSYRERLLMNLTKNFAMIGNLDHQTAILGLARALAKPEES